MGKTLLLPPAIGGQGQTSLEDVSSLVVVGANGAGKSRMGAWIEENPPGGRKTHRIAAQRALGIPESVAPQRVDMAENMLLMGHTGGGNRRGHRWGNKPTVHQLNDYQHVLALLFARQGQMAVDYMEQSRMQRAWLEPPSSEIERLVQIWHELLPHRGIRFHDGKVYGSLEGKEYGASDMSDGERVAVYLLGQSLCAPDGCIVVVDEPELHLHKAVVHSLWDRIERERPDCTFVYITHDLHFAAGRVGARRLWVSAYSANRWEYSLLADSELPESLRLEVLGSRRPVLFTEGEYGSDEWATYTTVYPGHHVV